MKYINADELKFLINEIYPDAQDSRTCGEMDALNKVYDLIDSLQQEQGLIVINKKDWEAQEQFRKNKVFGKPLQQERQEMDLEKFTERMDAWKARYNYPDNIPIKATMAFTARMFYMYPKVAREWYDNLPKVTQD